jgi:hypothetical protein
MWEQWQVITVTLQQLLQQALVIVLDTSNSSSNWVKV